MPTLLSRRQQRLYSDFARIYKPVQQFASDSTAHGDAWLRVGDKVPCHFEIRPNVDEWAAFGRYQTDTVFTLDLLHVAEFQDIGPDYVVLNQTVDPDGTPSVNFGLYWRVRGPARNISKRPRRDAGKRQVFIYLLPEPPQGLP